MPASLPSSTTRSFGHLSITRLEPPSLERLHQHDADGKREAAQPPRSSGEAPRDGQHEALAQARAPAPPVAAPADSLDLRRTEFGRDRSGTQPLGEDRVGGVDRKAHVNRLGPQPRHGAPDPRGIEQIDRPSQSDRILLDDQFGPETQQSLDRIVEHRFADARTNARGRSGPGAGRRPEPGGL